MRRRRLIPAVGNEGEQPWIVEAVHLDVGVGRLAV